MVCGNQVLPESWHIICYLTSFWQKDRHQLTFPRQSVLETYKHRELESYTGICADKAEDYR
jgi:hypothetical protein